MMLVSDYLFDVIYYSHDVTMLGVTEGLTRLNKIGVDFSRPSDFFADMLKSDHQMLKASLMDIMLDCI